MITYTQGKVAEGAVGDLSLPLQIIFSNSLRLGQLPDLWTESTVIPLYKKSSRFDPLNYRPVSLTSVVCKVMERVLVAALWSYINDKNLITREQFGFRSGYSTVDQLILTYNEIGKCCDEGDIVDLVFFDYSKAFDRVSHIILLDKLYQLGICGSILNWIRSFLFYRSMRVRVAGNLSNPCTVESGVPQGSVLGPVLFLLYINHVVSELTCNVKIFADDIKIYLGYSLTSGDEASSLLQCNIDKLVSTSSSWNLSINSEKCAVLRFSPRNCTLPFSVESPYNVNEAALQFVREHPDLGIKIERNLKFHNHIRSRVNVAGALTTNLLSSTICREPDFILNVYISHIRPQLEYASSLWNLGYIGDSQMIEKIQRRWTKAVATVQHLTYSERLRNLNLFSMYGRMLRADLILVWKIFNGKCAIRPTDLFERSYSHITRGHAFKIQVDRSRLEIRKRSFACRVVPFWNNLASDTVIASSLNRFKSLLHRDLGDELFKFY